MNNISSKYIIQLIPSYIIDDNIIYKLFRYSKALQDKFNIYKNEYQVKYFEKRIDFKKYLSDYNITENKLKLQNILLDYQINENDFNNIALIYFEKYFNNINNNKYLNHEYLDISFNSPYFDTFSKSKFFKNFNVKIDIKKDKSKNACILEFDKLNEINSNYTSISFYCNEKDDINYLKNSNINFNQIKSLKLSIFENSVNLDFFFNTLFSFNYIENNLLYLHLKISEYEKKIDSKLFEKINNFKSLEYLTLFNFIFDNFEIKLNTLKYLNLNNCRNIMFKENIFLKLKYLNLNSYSIKRNPSFLLKCPNVESCEVFSNIGESIYYDLIFDFSSINKLKYFKGQSKYFILLENTLLEKVIIDLDFYGVVNHFKKVMNKLLSTNTIKDLEINMATYSLIFMSNYKGENDSITKLKLNINNNNAGDNYQYLYKILDKFPNLSKFDLNINKYSKALKLELSSFSINFKSKYKINDISLHLPNIQNGITIYCGHYKKLKSVFLSIWRANSIIEASFPIFDKRNNVIFPSLVSFHFESDEKSITSYDFNGYHVSDFNILENLNNNFYNMPNLEIFYFSFGFFDLISQKQLFMIIVQKIFSLKFIKSIYFTIYEIGQTPLNIQFYSKNELIDLFPNLNLNIFHEIKISKI